MSGNINYQKELDKLLTDEVNKGKRLFLHSCCAPCSSYVLTYLSSFFDITVFYFNPNITSVEEYEHRVKEQKRLIDALNENGKIYEWDAAYGSEAAEIKPVRIPIKFLEGSHEVYSFYEAAKGLEDAREGGQRCQRCFDLRLRETARLAAENGFDFFGTTLTISPLKNAELINNIGMDISKEYGVTWLPSDFKKKEGYKHSIELSAEYDLYRQNYCGCEFSRNIELKN